VLWFVWGRPARSLDRFLKHRLLWLRWWWLSARGRFPLELDLLESRRNDIWQSHYSLVNTRLLVGLVDTYSVLKQKAFNASLKSSSSSVLHSGLMRHVSLARESPLS
jgi:hypothetical protein